MAANPVPAKPGAKSKRENPAEKQMSRADSLSSMGEFGSIVPLSKQSALREQKKKPKMGPFNRLMNALSGK